MEYLAVLAAVVGLGAAAPDSIAPSADRQADRDAIRSHIDEIFHAYMRRDRKVVRATHAEDWRGFIRPSRGIVRGILQSVFPADTMAINAGEEAWPDHTAILAGAKAVAASGTRLVRLEFPQTEIRVYGDVAILYTTYSFDLESAGERRRQAGRGTEIFVYRDGRWQNPGWHLDSGR